MAFKDLYGLASSEEEREEMRRILGDLPVEAGDDEDNPTIALTTDDPVLREELLRQRERARAPQEAPSHDADTQAPATVLTEQEARAQEQGRPVAAAEDEPPEEPSDMLLPLAERYRRPLPQRLDRLIADYQAAPRHVDYFIRDQHFQPGPDGSANHSGNTRIRDEGWRVRCNTKRMTAESAIVMVNLAKAHGWESIELSGTPRFKERMWLECQMAGIAVSNYEPSPELQARIAEMQAARERFRQKQLGQQPVVGAETPPGSEARAVDPDQTPAGVSDTGAEGHEPIGETPFDPRTNAFYGGGADVMEHREAAGPGITPPDTSPPAPNEEPAPSAPGADAPPSASALRPDEAPDTPAAAIPALEVPAGQAQAGLPAALPVAEADRLRGEMLDRVAESRARAEQLRDQIEPLRETDPAAIREELMNSDRMHVLITNERRAREQHNDGVRKSEADLGRSFAIINRMEEKLLDPGLDPALLEKAHAARSLPEAARALGVDPAGGDMTPEALKPRRASLEDRTAHKARAAGLRLV